MPNKLSGKWSTLLIEKVHRTKCEAEHGNKEKQEKNCQSRENGHRMFPDQLKEHN